MKIKNQQKNLELEKILGVLDDSVKQADKIEIKKAEEVFEHCNNLYYGGGKEHIYIPDVSLEVSVYSGWHFYRVFKNPSIHKDKTYGYFRFSSFSEPVKSISTPNDAKIYHTGMIEKRKSSISDSYESWYEAADGAIGFDKTPPVIYKVSFKSFKKFLDEKVSQGYGILEQKGFELEKDLDTKELPIKINKLNNNQFYALMSTPYSTEKKSYPKRISDSYDDNISIKVKFVTDGTIRNKSTNTKNIVELIEDRFEDAFKIDEKKSSSKRLVGELANPFANLPAIYDLVYKEVTT